MGLFDKVGGIGKTDAGFGVKKPENNFETKHIGIISFKFEKPSVKEERAVEVFGEEDAEYAMHFADFAANFDPEANLL